METVSNQVLEQAVALLGNRDLTQEQIEVNLCASGIKPETALRLVLLIPEAFGFTLAAHLNEKIAPIDTFSVREKDGKWVSVPFAAEPIFVSAMSAAQSVYHSGPRAVFQSIASRGSVMSGINNALIQGASIQGATMAIAFNGIPAETYPKVKRTLFEKFLDWRWRKIKKAATTAK